VSRIAPAAVIASSHNLVAAGPSPRDISTPGIPGVLLCKNACAAPAAPAVYCNRPKRTCAARAPRRRSYATIAEKEAPSRPRGPGVQQYSVTTAPTQGVPKVTPHPSGPQPPPKVRHPKSPRTPRAPNRHRKECPKSPPTPGPRQRACSLLEGGRCCQNDYGHAPPPPVP
jgi:hypothetical protein